MNKWAVVTGASSGIGYEIAQLLARGGYDLLVVARSRDNLEELERELERRYETEVKVLVQDLAKPHSAEKVYEAARQLPGDVEVLINNAGFGDYAEFTDSDWKKTHDMINLNTLSLTYLTRLFAPGMATRGRGRILNVASTAAFFPGPNMAVYHATKHYVKALSVALAEELRGTGVTITTLCPGATASNFQAVAHLDNSQLVRGRKLPISREVAEFGYDAMMDGKGLVVPGVTNKIAVFLSRFLPLQLAARLVARATAQKE
jgi:short-subunit dehydrogenase